MKSRNGWGTVWVIPIVDYWSSFLKNHYAPTRYSISIFICSGSCWINSGQETIRRCTERTQPLPGVPINRESTETNSLPMTQQWLLTQRQVWFGLWNVTVNWKSPLWFFSLGLTISGLVHPHPELNCLSLIPLQRSSLGVSGDSHIQNCIHKPC